MVAQVFTIAPINQLSRCRIIYVIPSLIGSLAVKEVPAPSTPARSLWPLDPPLLVLGWLRGVLAE